MKNNKLLIFTFFILNISSFIFFFYFIFFNKETINSKNNNRKIETIKDFNTFNKKLVQMILLKNFKENKYYQNKKIKIKTQIKNNNIIFNFYETNKNINDFVIKKLYKEYIKYEKLISRKKINKNKKINCKSEIFKTFFENNGTVIYNYFINNKFVNKLVIDNCEDIFKPNVKK